MRNEDLKDILEANFSGVRAELKANADVMYMLHQQVEKQNARVNKLESKVEKNTTWRIRITAIGTAVSAIVAFLFTKLKIILDALR